MEWRQQTSVSSADAFNEAKRWIEEVTGKSFGCSDFRAALENGVLLCNLINQLKPGIIKRVNRLSTPIAGLDNVNVFLKACEKLGLNESQLFHPGDLQDISTRVTLRRDEGNRRLKNVLITIYWLGRKAHLDTLYNGPQLNLKAFEGLLGLALSKALDEGGVPVKDSSDSLCQNPEEECQYKNYRRGNSADSTDSFNSQALHPNVEGFGGDAEAEQVFKMENKQVTAHQNKGYVPLLRRKQGPEENGSGFASQFTRASQTQVKPERPVQVNPGWIWSKSLSDIPMVYPVRKAPDANTSHDESQDTGLTRLWNQDNRRKCSVAAKDAEAQWQDDLKKWKTRRRSTKSELRTKSQDREHVMDKMINGSVTTIEKNEAKLKYQQSPWTRNTAPRPYSTTSPSKSSSDLRPHTRALLARSYATEAPFSPTVPLSSQSSTHAQGGAVVVPDGKVLGEEIHFASMTLDEARVGMPSLGFPVISQTQVKSQSSTAPFQSTCELSQPQNGLTNQISTHFTALQLNETTNSKSNKSPTLSMSSERKAFFYVHPELKTAGEDLSHQNDNSQEDGQKSSWQAAAEQSTAPQTPGVYKFLPRTVSWSGSASLPRGYRRSEGSSRLSSAITARPFGTKQSRVSSLPRMYNVDDNQGVLLNSEREDSPSSPSLKRQTATAQLSGPYQTNQGQEEQVTSSNLSSQTTFQSSGYYYRPSIQSQILPQPYSNLQSRQNRGLTFSADGSTDLPKVDHSDMRVSLTLKPNSLADFGFHTHWDSTGVRVKLIQPGSPAELCQLRVDDEIVAVDGAAVAHMNSDQWRDKMSSALQTGSLTMDVRRYGNKDWSTGEGTHHSQPGQSRVTLNLTAASSPVLIGCPDHHANSAAFPDTQVTQGFKSNGHTDNVMQGKVMGGELCETHGTTRNKGGSESAISDLQVPSLSPPSSSWSWDLEEDRRRQEKWQEEQERLLQEKYQRDQERLEAEWRRDQRDVIDPKNSGSQKTFEVTSGDVGLARTQQQENAMPKKTREEEQSTDGEKLKELLGPKRQSNAHEVQNEMVAQQDWADGSCGFAQLSPAHRTKSLSSPVLAGPHKYSRGDQSKRKGLSVAKAEKERQQILEEMKKRTQLLTDNSWIRQRSSSFYKDPMIVGLPLKRYDSLDNLDNLRQPQSSIYSYPRPHSAAAGYVTPSRNASSRYSTGSVLSLRNPYIQSCHQARMVNGRRNCSVCGRILGSRPAMVIEALSLYFHLGCFQCVGCHQHLGGRENGAQVQIRNRKPFCERCYFQLRCTMFTCILVTPM
ncbi:LIM domain only protein 7-like isoform X1 [Astatotilapia calliptera]|uniref:LIM domain only protein 7-like isoform X1 n=1 Tax=Astatotilapia calliptera TaxID=8154 RepID=UPI000E407044|nr:LIM domain only protein 7-like isoform X1 [Astatotilapia calliptera]XP_026021568.1 LIM domain only protein 7-like isoform X1 [Astatotilapia calliptera]XP_026021576.1 LIM domain only protein 7-like isoform X1 [Astatotilapia calliptera]XP_026021584.1 LIM domain only protein 7-like isoform X1 [Astatotilapia calliptera]